MKSMPYLKNITWPLSLANPLVILRCAVLQQTLLIYACTAPQKLFASKYSTEQLKEWAAYITGIAPGVTHVYVYFNNDFHGYALEIAKELASMLSAKKLQ